MMALNRGKRMLFFCMHPLNNVPPPLNAAIYFGERGYQVIVICYHDEGLPRIERLGEGARLFRMKLRSRKIRISVLRYVFAIVEFLWKCKIIFKRLKPDIVVTFNEIASILQHLELNGRSHLKKIAWLLEFPENIDRSLGKKLIFDISVRSWKYADTVIAPTRERLSMACVLQPDLIHKDLFVIHNASLAKEIEFDSRHSKRFYEVQDFVQDGLRKDDVKIIYAGAIGNRYGLDQLILAVGNSEQPISLLVLGKKHDLSLREFNDALSKVKYKKRVQWIDSIDYREMKLILPWFDVGYVTYVGDTLNTYFAAPGKVYEYLKAGLIILTDAGITICDDLVQYQCGVFFEKPVQAKQIQERLELLAGKLSSVPVMKDNARKLFIEKYSFEKQMEKLTEHLA